MGSWNRSGLDFRSAYLSPCLFRIFGQLKLFRGQMQLLPITENENHVSAWTGQNLSTYFSVKSVREMLQMIPLPVTCVCLSYMKHREFAHLHRTKRPVDAMYAPTEYNEGIMKPTVEDCMIGYALPCQINIPTKRKYDSYGEVVLISNLQIDIVSLWMPKVTKATRHVCLVLVVFKSGV